MWHRCGSESSDDDVFDACKSDRISFLWLYRRREPHPTKRRIEFPLPLFCFYIDCVKMTVSATEIRITSSKTCLSDTPAHYTHTKQKRAAFAAARNFLI